MFAYRTLLLYALLITCTGTRAAPPIPEVTGSTIHWPAVDARTINVHRGDGSFLESLPGNASSWDAPEPGSYFLVAATTGHWSEWQRSAIVVIEALENNPAPVPFVTNRIFISWPPVSANSINVHRGDGSYVESLPGDATIWLPDQFGDYFLVAANDGDWQTWPRSSIVSVSNPYSVDDVITDLTANIYSQSAAEIFWNWTPETGTRFEIRKDGDAVALIDGTSWFSNDYLPGSTSVITVNAVYEDGERSNSRSLAVMTPGSSSEALPILGQHNYDEILAEAFGVYFGSQYRARLRHFANRTVSDLRPADATNYYLLTSGCSDGGVVIFNDPFSLELVDCIEGSITYNGSFNIHSTYGDTDRVSSSGFTMVSGDGDTLYFSGSLDGALSEQPGWYEAWNMEFSSSGPDSALHVTEAYFSYTFPHLNRGPSDPFLFRPYFGGNYLLQSNTTGMNRVNVSTLRDFRHSQLFTESSDWNFTDGILHIAAEDGSRIVLNADSGNKDTVKIQLGFGDMIEQFELMWNPEWAVWREYVDLQR